MRGGTTQPLPRNLWSSFLLYGLHSKPTSQAIHTQRERDPRRADWTPQNAPFADNACGSDGARRLQRHAPITLTSISSYTTTSSMSGPKAMIGRAAQRCRSGMTQDRQVFQELRLANNVTAFSLMVVVTMSTTVIDEDYNINFADGTAHYTPSRRLIWRSQHHAGYTRSTAPAE